MNKNFTHQYFNYLIKTLLIAAMVCLTLFHPGTAGAVDNAGMINMQVKNVKCYPNPAISFINFDLPADYINKNYYSLQVFSFTGKKMYEINVTSPKLTITFTNDYYRGIYIYQFRDANGRIVETGKFQVNK